MSIPVMDAKFGRFLNGLYFKDGLKSNSDQLMQLQTAGKFGGFLSRYGIRRWAAFRRDGVTHGSTANFFSNSLQFPSVDDEPSINWFVPAPSAFIETRLSLKTQSQLDRQKFRRPSQVGSLTPSPV